MDFEKIGAEKEGMKEFTLLVEMEAYGKDGEEIDDLWEDVTVQAKDEETAMDMVFDELDFGNRVPNGYVEVKKVVDIKEGASESEDIEQVSAVSPEKEVAEQEQANKIENKEQSEGQEAMKEFTILVELESDGTNAPWDTVTVKAVDKKTAIDMVFEELDFGDYRPTGYVQVKKIVDLKAESSEPKDSE